MYLYIYIYALRLHASIIQSTSDSTKSGLPISTTIAWILKLEIGLIHTL